MTKAGVIPALPMDKKLGWINDSSKIVDITEVPDNKTDADVCHIYRLTAFVGAAQDRFVFRFSELSEGRIISDVPSRVASGANIG
jgi:hypothetical protein